MANGDTGRESGESRYANLSELWETEKLVSAQC